ncbi:uncharacterized protein LOC132741116 [Ruditapes philippinarum]|uniref:uncharacterized protein LOC132741116 n=1 Tax=Ruditapes philippinarum TaxID=129788 RepID=UPI00295AF6E1|nr:uncharacterized protein LOC132741116 [Ruditapes philippinarum]
MQTTGFRIITFGMMEESFKDPDFQENFVGSIYELWRNGKLCDASIEVGSRVFKFHKIVLAICSPEFLNMNETRLVIQLPVETDISALEAVLQYVYSGELKLTENTIESVQKLATMFKIDKILEFCGTFHSELIGRTKNTDERNKSKSERQSLQRSCGIKAGPRSSRGRGQWKKSEVCLANEPLQAYDLDTCRESACVSPSKGKRGRRKMNSRAGKASATSLLKACRLKLDTSEDYLEEEKIVKFPVFKDSLRTSPRKRKNTAKLQSDVLTSGVKVELDKTTQEVAEKQIVKVDSIRDSAKPCTLKLEPTAGKHSPLTRAEIQRAYRARKMAKMSLEELEEFKMKERARARKNLKSSKSASSVSTGKERRKNVAKRGCSKSKSTLKKEAESIKSEPEICKVLEQVKKKNNRQKRYRDRMKNNPDWRRKEAERTRKRYIPVSQLSKKEQKLRRLRESERTRLWRLKKKLQRASLPVETAEEDKSITDISGKIFVSRNMHETFSGESGQDIVENSEIVIPDHADACMVNSIIHSLNDQFQYMLVGEGNDASEIVKEEVIDPEYHCEENVAIIEPVTDNTSTGSDIHQTIGIFETDLCNNEIDRIDKGDIDAGDTCIISDFCIKTEDGELIICKANHESVSDVNEDVDNDNDSVDDTIHEETV